MKQIDENLSFTKKLVALAKLVVKRQTNCNVAWLKNKVKNMSKTIQKPWGGYTEHYRTEDNSIVIKTLRIDPKQQLSIQYHNKRAELWKFDSFESIYELTYYNLSNPKQTIPITNLAGYIYIPPTLVHSIKNLGDSPLYIEEIQFGECLEEDIVRLYDPYNRQ